jgi:polyisoprenoid-binding protein YceI
MKTFPLVGLVLAVAASPSLGGELEINLDAASTSAAFTLGATLHTVHGEATVKSGSFRYQRETGLLTGQVVVDAATADTGNKKRDKKMHAKVLLSGDHPRIVLEAQRLDGELALEGDSDVLLRGDIGLLGLGHEIEIPLHIVIEDGRFEATGVFEIPYVAWGLDDPSTFVLRVAKVVEIAVTATGTISSLDDTRP